MLSEYPPRLRQAWFITTVTGPLGLILGAACWSLGSNYPNWFWLAASFLLVFVGGLSMALWVGMSLGLFMDWLMKEKPMSKRKPKVTPEPGELLKANDSMGPHWTYRGRSIYQMAAGKIIVPTLWVGRDTSHGTFTSVEEATAAIDAWEGS